MYSELELGLLELELELVELELELLELELKELELELELLELKLELLELELELLELELLNSSCDDLVRWNGMGEGIGVGMGEGNSLIGDKHFEKLNPGTSSVMVGAPLLIDEFSVNMASPLHS